MRRSILVAGIVALACASALLPAHVVRRFALYVADGRGPISAPYRLFLDPFPDAITCARQAQAINAEGGHARCSSYLAITADTRLDDEIAAEFNGAAGRCTAYCSGLAQRRTAEAKETAAMRKPSLASK